MSYSTTNRRGQFLFVAFTAFVFSLAAQIQVAAQNDYKGYKVGRYEGEIVNTTYNVKSTAAFEIRKIDRVTGEVTTFLTPTSSNLSGEGTLTGKIDENGVLRVSGSFAGMTAGVVARVSGDTIKANYSLSGGGTQNGTFTAKLTTTAGETKDIPVPDADDEPQTNRSNHGADGAPVAQEKKSIGAKYGSREPQTCEETTASTKGAITAALAKRYFICAQEAVFGPYLYLVENVIVQVGASRAFNPRTDGFSDIDSRLPVYPIRGSYTRYQCATENTTNPNFPINIGKNCDTYEKSKASGFCYKTTFGDWKCNMSDLITSDADNRRGVAPPQAERAAPEAKKPSF